MTNSAIGIILYMIYVVNVGGDYMHGRFLAIPFLISLFLLITHIKQASQSIVKFLFLQVYV